jgi:GTP-binding protein
MRAPPATIAIVGRPNVGKSTLFNRLTGRRAALVDATPGLTRDRREGEAVIGRRTVRLIDTAGLEEAGQGTIEARMRAQSEAAIGEADLVLFVIDARAGVTPSDRAFAALVRKAAKPVLLIANKSESRAADAGYYEAFALGLGDPVAISAEHGEGLSDLYGEVDRLLPAIEDADPLLEGEEPGDAEAAPDRPLKVAIVGRPNAGKSTLVNALLGEERVITGPEPGLTRDAIEIPFEWQGRRLVLTDTAGLRRKSRITARPEQIAASDAVRAIRFAEVVVLLIDAERPLEKQDLTIGDLVAEEGRALVIAVNKWDLVEEPQKRLRELRAMVAESLAQVSGVPVVSISALSERGLDKLMAAVVKAYELWNRRLPTNALNRWLEATLAHHPPPAVRGRPLRLRFMTQPHARPPTFVIFGSRPEELPKSYLRYLENELRQAFDLPGVPLRLQLRRGKNPYEGRRSD